MSRKVLDGFDGYLKYCPSKCYMRLMLITILENLESNHSKMIGKRC